MDVVHHLLRGKMKNRNKPPTSRKIEGNGRKKTTTILPNIIGMLMSLVAHVMKLITPKYHGSLILGLSKGLYTTMWRKDKQNSNRFLGWMEKFHTKKINSKRRKTTAETLVITQAITILATTTLFIHCGYYHGKEKCVVNGSEYNASDGNLEFERGLIHVPLTKYGALQIGGISETLECVKVNPGVEIEEGICFYTDLEVKSVELTTYFNMREHNHKIRTKRETETTTVRPSLDEHVGFMHEHFANVENKLSKLKIPIVICLIILFAFKTKNLVLIVILIATQVYLLEATTTNGHTVQITKTHTCYDPEQFDVLESTGYTKATIYITGERCSIIRVPGFDTIEIIVLKKIIEPRFEHKMFLLGAQAKTKSSSRCPGAGSAPVPCTPSDKVFCHVGYTDRGWTDGCFVFGKGEVVTCVSISYSDPFYSWLVKHDDAKWEIEVLFGGEESRRKMIQISDGSGPMEVEDEKAGKVRITCQTPYFNWDSDFLIAKPGENFFKIPKELLEDVNLPWSDFVHPFQSTEKIRNGESIVKFGTPGKQSIPVSIAGNLKQLYDNLKAQGEMLMCEGDGCSMGKWTANNKTATPKLIQTPGTLKCVIDHSGLKMHTSTTSECNGQTSSIGEPKVNKDTVMIWLRGTGTDTTKCKILIEGKQHTSNTWIKNFCENHSILQEMAKNGQVLVKLHCPGGRLDIRINKNLNLNVEVKYSQTMKILTSSAVHLRDILEHLQVEGASSGLLSKIMNLISAPIVSFFKNIFGVTNTWMLLAVSGFMIWIGANSKGNLGSMCMIIGLIMGGTYFVERAEASKYVVMLDTDELSVSVGKARHIEWEWRLEVPLLPNLPYRVEIDGLEAVHGATIFRVNSIEEYTNLLSALALKFDTIKKFVHWFGNSWLSVPCRIVANSSINHLEEDHKEGVNSGTKIAILASEHVPITCGECIERFINLELEEIIKGTFQNLHKYKLIDIAKPICKLTGNWTTQDAMNKYDEYENSTSDDKKETNGGNYGTITQGEKVWKYQIIMVGGVKLQQTTEFEGVIDSIEKTKREWKNMTDWSCDQYQKDSKINRGHILARNMNGQASGYNCFLQTIEENQKDVDIESAARDSSLKQRTVLKREIRPKTHKAIYTTKTLSEDNLMCGWNGEPKLNIVKMSNLNKAKIEELVNMELNVLVQMDKGDTQELRTLVGNRVPVCEATWQDCNTHDYELSYWTNLVTTAQSRAYEHKPCQQTTVSSLFMNEDEIIVSKPKKRKDPAEDPLHNKLPKNEPYLLLCSIAIFLVRIDLMLDLVVITLEWVGKRSFGCLKLTSLVYQAIMDKTIGSTLGLVCYINEINCRTLLTVADIIDGTNLGRWKEFGLSALITAIVLREEITVVTYSLVLVGLPQLTVLYIITFHLGLTVCLVFVLIVKYYNNLTWRNLSSLELTHFAPVLIVIPHMMEMPNPWVWTGIITFLLFMMTQGSLEIIYTGKMQTHKMENYDCKVQIGKVYWTTQGIEAEILSEVQQQNNQLLLAIVYIAIVLLCSMCHWSLGISSLFIMGPILSIRQTQTGLIATDDNVETTTGQFNQLKEGFYSINIKGLFGLKQIGVGYCYKGTLTTQYHVTCGRNIWFNGKEYAPVEENPVSDYACYFGSWTFPKIESGKDFQLIMRWRNKTLKTRGVCSGCYYAIPTEPIPKGQSGTPIFQELGGQLRPVAMAGNSLVVGEHNIQVGENPATIPHLETIIKKLIDRKGHMEEVVLRCGAGKTRGVIKSALQSATVAGVRVLVLTPTRVVAKEAYNSLKDLGSVGICTSTLTQNVGLSHMVMCHTTLARRIMRKGKGELNKWGLIVVDEAHFNNSETLALHNMFQNDIRCLSPKYSVLYLTATGYTKQDASTNFTVVDYPIAKYEDFFGVVDRNLNKKIVWFVSSVKEGVEVYKKLREKNVNAQVVARSTFERTYPKAKEMTEGVVITTNISEMGANYQADIVIDSLEHVVPVLQDDGVHLEKRVVTRASRTQRRGRVGRMKLGEYYYLAANDSMIRENLFHVDDVLWTEAEICTILMGELWDICNFQGTNPPSPGNYQINNTKRTGMINLTEEGDWTYYTAYNFINDIGDPIMYDLSDNSLPIKADHCDRCRNLFFPFWDERNHDQLISRGVNNVNDQESTVVESTTAVVIPMVRNAARAITRRIMSSGEGPGCELMTMLFGVGCSTWMSYLDPVANSVALAQNLVPPTYRHFMDPVKIFYLILGVLLTSVLKLNFTILKPTFENQYQGHSKMLMIMTIISAICHNKELYVHGYPVWQLMGTIFVIVVMYESFCGISTRQKSSGEAAGIVAFLVLLFLSWYFLNDGEILTLTKRYLRRQIELLDQEVETNKVRVNRSEFMAENDRKINLEFEIVPMIYFCLHPFWLQVARSKSVVAILQFLDNVKLRQTPKALPPPTILFIASLLSLVFMMSEENLISLIYNQLFVLPIMIVMFMAYHSDALKRFINTNIDIGNNNTQHIPFIDPQFSELYRYSGIMMEIGIAMYSKNVSVESVLILLHYLAPWIPGSLGEGLNNNAFISLGLAFKRRNVPLSIIYAITIGLEHFKTLKRFRSSGFTSQILNRLSEYFEDLEHSGKNWKSKLNKLDRAKFLKYRLENVMECTNLKEFASRGYCKMDWLITEGHFKPKGKVYDLGCGAGGFSQRICFEESVIEVKGRTLAKRDHHFPEFQNDYSELAYKKFTWIKQDVFNQNYQADTIVMDIGECHSNPDIEIQGDIKRLLWFKENCKAENWCIKIMAPYSTEVLKNLPKGSTLIRTPFSRNSNMEMYCVKGSGDPAKRVANVLSVLNQRMDRKNQLGPQFVTLNLPFFSPTETEKRKKIDKNRVKHLNLREDGKRTFKHWEFLGSVDATRKGSSGQFYNRIIMAIISGIRNVIPTIEHWNLTSTQPEDTFSTFLRKVDTTPRPLGRYRERVRDKFDWLSQRFLNEKGLSPRVLTNEEVVMKFKNDSALGSKCQHFGDVKRAFEDPKFWFELGEEIHNHSKGICTRGVFDVIGKKEKKDLYGKPRGSRLIMYLDLVERFIEHKYLGFLNQDHWCNPINLESGVSNVSPYEYPKIIVEKVGIDPLSDKMEKHVIQDDTAGWDTRLHHEMLEEEERFLLKMTGDEKHRNHISTIYKNYKRPIIRITDEDGSKDLILGGYGQRCSGTVVTYSMNTITNTVVQMIRVQEKTELSNEQCLKSMLVSGDDCLLILTPDEAQKVSRSIRFLNETGLLRKDVETNKPSEVIKNWRNISFCSHGITKGRCSNGEWLWTLDKHEAEILGKAQLQLGLVENNENWQAQAKAMALYLILTFPMRRDVRLVAKAIMACCQEGIVPMGKIKEPLIWGEPWLEPMDIVQILNKIYGTNFSKLSEVPYVKHKSDMERGSPVHQNSRKNWKKYLIEKMVPDLAKENNTPVNWYWLEKEHPKGCSLF
uniref:Polyprotein n=1 Tax=Bebevirus sp. TaxID=3163420 RepID=A0AAU7SS05_9VIRU